MRSPLTHFDHTISVAERAEENSSLEIALSAFKRFLFVGTIEIPTEDADTSLTSLRAPLDQRKGIMSMSVKRGDIYYADLSPVVGSEQGGLRPVLIVQNDIGNRYSPTVIAAAITSRMSKAKLPTHIDIFAEEVGLAKDSVILLEQIRTLDKRRLKEKMGHLDDAVMNHVNTAIAISFGLGSPEQDAAARAMMQHLPYVRTSPSPPQVSPAPTAVAVADTPHTEG